MQDEWQDISSPSPSSNNEWQDVTPPKKEDTSDSLIGNLWKTISEPIPAIKEWGQKNIESLQKAPPSWMNNFMIGAHEGAINLMSPLNIGTAALGGLEFGAGKAGLTSIANLASMANKASGIPVAMHGIHGMLSPESTLGQRAGGLAEFAGGALPFLHTPKIGNIAESAASHEIPTEIPPSAEQISAAPPPVEQPNVDNIINQINGPIQPIQSEIQPELPQFSLADRPAETRTTQELQDRITLLESKPFLNEGGKRALATMKDEVAKRQELENANFEDMPEAARTETGGVKIGADVKSLGRVLGTSLYKGDISTIATKELLQNSLDATRHLGPNGKIRVNFDENNGIIHVMDNGKGMTPDEIQSIFTDLGSSGKREDESAVGGFGLAKAAPLLGGEHVEVNTVARDPNSNNLLVRTSFSGTPDELLEGVKMGKTIVPEGSPTGTSVKVKVPEGKYGYSFTFSSARNLVNKIKGYSDIPGKLEGTTSTKYSETPSPFTSGGRVGTRNLANIPDEAGSVGILQPSTAEMGQRESIRLHLMNKGMYQSSTTKYLNQAAPGIPSDLLINIDAKVPEGHPNYPFTANRESLRGSLEKAVNSYIDEHVVNPAYRKHAKGLQDLYDGMPSVTTPAGSQIYFHDTNAKFTPEEYSQFMNHPIIQSLGDQISDMVNGTLHTLGIKSPYAADQWLNRLDRVGIIFDQGLKGIHIPNPSTGHSAVMINPLQIMKDKSPDESAMGFVHTILHEMAHIDPGVRGHNEDFAIRLSEVHEHFGARRTIDAQQNYLNTIAPTGEYLPEVQGLLQRYSETRGRGASKEDILSRTGIASKTESRSKTSGGKTPIASREGTSIIVKNADPFAVKQIIEQGYKFKGLRDDGSFEFIPGGGGPTKPPILESEVGGNRPTPSNARMMAGQTPPSNQPSTFHQIWNFPRTVMASMDFSAPLRQGLTLVHKKAFWTSIDDMFKAWGSENAYKQIQKDIVDRPLFKPRVLPNGNEVKSFAEEAGLKLTDLKSISTREEAIASEWAEKVPGVRRSNRAYTVFLNKLRADSFEDLVKNSAIFGPDAKANLPLARELANFVNVASGRGAPLGIQSLEKSASSLNNVLFSPRLIGSRLTLMNPKYYIMANPAVRKEALKSLFAVAAVGNTLTQLGKLAGGTVESDPASSDFGKLKIGNVRLDPYGGFQQYIVAASRLMSGRDVSSTSGKEYDLTNPRGPYDPTYLGVMGNMVRSKLHPVLGFAWSLLNGQKEMTGQKMNFSTPNPMDNAVMQRFTPILFQDLSSIAQEDPSLLPILGPLSTFGMNTQVYGGQQ